MSRVKSDPVTATDAELIRDVRAGDNDAYGLLYERHAPAAQRFARRLAGNPHAADDALADAFTKILAAIRNGSGPTTSFRPYLFTAVRTTVIRGTRWRKRVDLTDPAGWDLPGDEATSDPADRALILEAFATLPERSRAVLWHLEAEGLTPAEVAPILGLSANGVSALAYRSREALRQAYLHAHLAQPLPGACRSVADLLPAKVRDDLTTRQRRIVDDHLHGCTRCREAVTELDDVAAAFRTVAGPLIGAGGLWSLLRRTSHVSLPVSPRRVVAVAAIAALSLGSGQLLLHRSPIERADAMPTGIGATPKGADGVAGATQVGDDVPIRSRVPLADRQAASGPTNAGSAPRTTAKAPTRPIPSATRPAKGQGVEAAADQSIPSSPTTPSGVPTSAGAPGNGVAGVGVDVPVPGVVDAGVDVTVGLRPGAVRADASVDANVANAVDADVDVAADVDLTAPSVDAAAQADVDLLDLVQAGVDVGTGLDLRDGSVDLGTAIAAGLPRVASLSTDLGLAADLSSDAVDADTTVAADLLDAVETDANLAADVDLAEVSLDTTAQADLELVDAVRAGVDVDAEVDLHDGTVSAGTAATADLAVVPSVGTSATVEATPTTAAATVTVDAPVAVEAGVSAATDPATGATAVTTAGGLDLGGSTVIQAGIRLDPSAVQPVDLDLSIGRSDEPAPTPEVAPQPTPEPAPAPEPTATQAPAPVTTTVTTVVAPVAAPVTAVASSVTGLLRAP